MWRCSPPPLPSCSSCCLPPSRFSSLSLICSPRLRRPLSSRPAACCSCRLALLAVCRRLDSPLALSSAVHGSVVLHALPRQDLATSDGSLKTDKRSYSIQITRDV